MLELREQAMLISDSLFWQRAGARLLVGSFPSPAVQQHVGVA